MIKNYSKKIKDEEFDPIIFEHMQTGCPLGDLWTYDGGLPRSTNWMISGHSGAGKSTLLMQFLGNHMTQGLNVLHISAEMNEVDLAVYEKRFPLIGEIETIFPQKLTNELGPKEFTRFCRLCMYDSA